MPITVTKPIKPTTEDNIMQGICTVIMDTTMVAKIDPKLNDIYILL